MLWSLLVFALTGLLAGAAARLFYSQRQPGQVIRGLIWGSLGGLCGGAISWLTWPFEEGRFHTGNLSLAALGAVLVLTAGAALAYVQDLAVRRSQARSE